MKNNSEVWVEQKKMRTGYTTGSCAGRRCESCSLYAPVRRSDTTGTSDDAQRGRARSGSGTESSGDNMVCGVRSAKTAGMIPM